MSLRESGDSVRACVSTNNCRTDFTTRAVDFSYDALNRFRGRLVFGQQYRHQKPSWLRTGGGEVVRYIAKHSQDRVAKAVLISSVPPIMVKTETNPGGLPKEVFDGLLEQVATNRAQFYRDLPETAWLVLAIVVLEQPIVGSPRSVHS